MTVVCCLFLPPSVLLIGGKLLGFVWRVYIYYPLKKLSPCPKMKIWTGLPQGHLAPNRRYKEVLVPVATLWCRQYKGLLQSKQEAIKSWHHSYSWLQIFKFVFGLNSQLGLCTLAPSLRVCHRAGSLVDWYWAN